MNCKALVSAHIFKDDRRGKDIEILQQVDNDDRNTEIFCDIGDFLLDAIDTKGQEDYFFMAIVQAESVKQVGYVDYGYETEYTLLKEIEKLEDLGVLQSGKNKS